MIPNLMEQLLYAKTLQLLIGSSQQSCVIAVIDTLPFTDEEMEIYREFIEIKYSAVATQV